MSPAERDPNNLIKNGELEKLDDFEMDTPEGGRSLDSQTEHLHTCVGFPYL